MISIIVPVYNKEKFVLRCINSLLEQKNVDLEIILVDDGSTDNSLLICKKIANEHNNITVISQENAGVSAARNNGLRHAKGEWISFVDPDDYVAPTLYEELLNASDGNDIVACCCVAVDGEKKKENHFFPSDVLFVEDNKNKLYGQLLDANYGQPGIAYTAIGVPWGKIYRRELLVNNSLTFNLKLRRQQDNIFNLHAFAFATRVQYIDKPLYFYTLDNIKNYYALKYNDYAAENAIEFQKEHYEFFVLGKKIISSDLKKLYDNAVVCNMFSALNMNILHRDNPQTYAERKNAFFRMLDSNAFGESLQLAAIDNIQGLFHKIVFVMIKRKQFWLMNLIWKSRSIYELVKFRKGTI